MSKTTAFGLFDDDPAVQIPPSTPTPELFKIARQGIGTADDLRIVRGFEALHRIESRLLVAQRVQEGLEKRQVQDEPVPTATEAPAAFVLRGPHPH